MALTVYPADDWNTFQNVADATTALELIGDGVKWGLLDTAEKEQRLVVSAMAINMIAVASDTCSFIMAQTLLIQFDLENDGTYLSFIITNDDEYKKAKVGSLEVEYNLDSKNNTGVGDINSFPPVVVSLLNGCLRDSVGVAGARGFTIA